MRRAALTIAAILTSSAVLAQGDDFVLEDTVAYCKTCHGEETGVPVEPGYPVIWGQQYFYIYTQLRDYGAGRRQHEIMTDIAAPFSRDQAKEIAQYFADLPWPEIHAEMQEGDVALAEQGISSGQCSACHGKWQGDSRIPRLAGQQVGYLSATMHAFKNEERMNAPDKISTMQQLDDPTIEALSRYLGSMQLHEGN